jgi:hypothetical protein
MNDVNIVQKRAETILSDKKLRGFSPQVNYTEGPPLVGEVSANFSG